MALASSDHRGRVPAEGRPTRPEPVDQDDATGFQPRFGTQLFEGPISLSRQGAEAALSQSLTGGGSLGQSYSFGTAWLRGPLQSFHWSSNGKGSYAWREVVAVVTCPKGVEGQRLTGGFSLALTHAPLERHSAVTPAHDSPEACGFTMLFLPQTLSVWTNTVSTEGASHGRSSTSSRSAAGPPKQVRHQQGQTAVTVHNGDAIRAVLAEDGWLDVLCQDYGTKRWRHVSGWQTPLDSAPVYAGMGLRHTTIVSLKKVRGERSSQLVWQRAGVHPSSSE